ncbi:MAG: hypothetical protein IJ055_04700 [Oscillospiraceae bacterium]|nr:hypothetical protein [Oscillospiraceae bacterium]
MKIKIPSRHRWLWTLLAGALIGAVVFVLIYGPEVLDPTYDDWLLGEHSDSTQHYIGWKYYRKTPWQFPVGLIEGLVTDQKISCIYLDCIPLFAVFFKLLSPLLPETFQYFGWWGLFSFAMQGGTAALLQYRLTGKPVFALLCTPIYAAAPTVLQRMYGHEALAGQWVILGGLLLWLYRDHPWKHPAMPILLWTGLGLLVAGMHPYLVPMVYVLLLAYAVTDYLMRRDILRPGLSFLSMTAGIGIVYYVLGAFHDRGSNASQGLGMYSSNYNTFYNPIDKSIFLRELPRTSEQYEGSAYLGLGVLAAGIVCIVLLCVRVKHSGGVRSFCHALPKEQRIRTVLTLVLIVGSVIAAASPRGMLNDRVLYDNAFLCSMPVIFRCTGRFIWLAYYPIMTWILSGIGRLPHKKAAAGLAVIVLLLQMTDLSGYIRTKRVGEMHYQSGLSDPRWEEICADADEFLFVPISPDYLTQWMLYYEFANYAADHDMTLSSFSAARMDFERIHSYAEEELARFVSGQNTKREIVVFLSDGDLPEENEFFELLTLDGYTIAVSRQNAPD